MHIKKDIKAISTLLAILLILLSAIIGALLAYMWTMAPFYREPEDIVDLIVTNVDFPVDHATFFEVTVMNPSHSIADANITDIYIESEGYNKTALQTSDPELPFLLQKGTLQTFNCSLDWGGLAGSVVTVHVLTMNNTQAARSVQTPAVRIQATTLFDPSESVEHFNVSITNANSPINLTISRVSFDYNPVENLSITLPKVIQPNETVVVTCYTSWEGHVKPDVKVETLEGFTAEIRTDVASTVSLQVTQVDFNETNTYQVGLTLFNSPDSATYVNVTSITFKHGNITDVMGGNLTNPTLPLKIDKNQTVLLTCDWNWTDATNRDVDVTVTANTTQGFQSLSKTVRTPPRYAARIDGVDFDIDDTGLFSVNITNLAYSLQAANVTGIKVNENPANITTALVSPGAQATFVCMFNWSGFVGESVTIKASLMYDSSETLLSNVSKLPYLKIVSASFFSVESETPYVNITVRNSEFSEVNATITQVLIRNETTPLLIVGSAGYEVAVGSEVGIVFPWDWSPYAGKDIIVIMTTADGFQASATYRVE